jgi:hypothetical protein
MPIGASPTAPGRTLGDVKAEAARLLTAQTTNNAAGGDNDRLVALISQTTGVASTEASQRVRTVESQMASKAKDAADTARKATSYVAIWTALALLFSAAVCVVSALFARAPDSKS